MAAKNAKRSLQEAIDLSSDTTVSDASPKKRSTFSELDLDFESQETLAPTDQPFKYIDETPPDVWVGVEKLLPVKTAEAPSAKQSKKKQNNNGASAVRVGAIVRAQYGTTNAETNVGDSMRTLLILRSGKSDETPYHKPHVTVKDGYWCMHGNECKFLVKSRFISSVEVNVVQALQFPDAPIVLRKEVQTLVKRTVNTLRKLNGSLTNCESGLHARAQMQVTGTF